MDAFGAADAGALAAYVSQQQSFIEATGKDAEGLLLQLGGTQAGNPLVIRWQATVADLNRYKLKSPTSSLTALEHFVLATAADIDIGNCLDKLSARAAQRRATDVFSERMQGLQAGLYSRCRELMQTGYQDAWTRFADAFNSGLANRAPFRALTPDGGKVASDKVPADVEEVGSVLKLFDRVHVLALASDRDPSRPSAATTVRKVDDQMQKVRDFLAPLYPTEEGQPVGLDVMVEFRANTAVESEGNKIIDWALTIGSQTLHQRDPARALRWEPGLPVVLTMRVAQDGPVIPKAEGGHPGMSVDERTISYRFEDPWALFSLVSAYREADAAPATGARSQLLKFEFPMTAIGDGKIATRDTRAKVFIRLTVSAAGKRTPLVWPPVFPVKAPAW
jgi:type VI secretion system protein ImpL